MTSKAAIAAAAALAASAACAQLGASGESTVIRQDSNVVTSWSYGKDIVTEEGGALKDRRGVLVSAADAAAEEETARGSEEVARAWADGFARGVSELESALTGLPRSGAVVGLRLPLIPRSARLFDIYVASNRYDAATYRDELYIYFGQDYTNPPTVTVPYVWDSGATTQRVVGVWSRPGTADHYTNVWTVAEELKGGRVTYPCRKLSAVRPPELRGLPLNLNPHGRWGGPDGVAFGAYALSVAGQPAYTGAVTNDEEGVVATFDNGSLVGLEPLQEDNQ